MEGVEKELQRIGERLGMQEVRLTQMQSTIREIAGWDAAQEEDDPGICGLVCQLDRLNETMERLLDGVLLLSDNVEDLRGSQADQQGMKVSLRGYIE